MNSERPASESARSETPGASARSLIAAATFGGTLGALGLALLTLQLNAAAAADPGTGIPLVLFFQLVGCCLGAVVGCFMAVVARLAGALVSRFEPTGSRVLALLLAFLPISYVLLLPEVGLAGSLLTDRIAAGRLQLALTIGVVAVLLAAVGLLLRAWGERRSIAPRFMVIAAGLLALLVLIVARPSDQQDPAQETALPPVSAETPAQPMVVLLCIDGADPRVLDRMIAAGELPAFAELRRRGTHGALASFSPTLSPAIWTTMITGQRPEEHGIFGFTRYRIPGLREPLDRFPVHAGLNFQLPRMIERIPGAPAPRIPYTRFDRDAPTVWQIHQYMVGGRSSAGVYRWRVTWPAEALAEASGSFMVAARVTLGEVRSAVKEHDPRLSYSSTEILSQARQARENAPKADESQVSSYLAQGVARSEQKKGPLAMIRRSLDYGPLNELVRLTERHRPDLLVAGFYSVDAFNHMFWRDLRNDGVFAPAIDQRYRFSDARLGDLLSALPADANVVVTSDHGFDFEHGHHTHAPPGILLAAGPAFERGRQVDGASVYDIAPLVLHLLGLPPGKDMPGSTSYRNLLAESVRDQGPPPVASWQGLMPKLEQQNVELPDDAETPAVLEELEALGYIE